MENIGVTKDEQITQLKERIAFLEGKIEVLEKITNLYHQDVASTDQLVEIYNNPLEE
jgi:chaperonin cofactor prefoldin